MILDFSDILYLAISNATANVETAELKSSRKVDKKNCFKSRANIQYVSSLHKTHLQKNVVYSLHPML
nr:hypothetical protein BgiMline_013616 [Biomphalaria glabrata]